MLFTFAAFGVRLLIAIEQESGDDLNLPLARFRPAGGWRAVMSV